MKEKLTQKEIAFVRKHEFLMKLFDPKGFDAHSNKVNQEQKQKETK